MYIYDENSDIKDGTGLYVHNSIFTNNEASIGGCMSFNTMHQMRLLELKCRYIIRYLNII